ncbi:MAG: phosphate ABC transporter ATP-binding protein [Bacteroidales bacterium]|nr:phosphate ABC transporter ATP-binding protein [Bacteroidales bacterium]MBR3286879.1 phosphate ABC transporter ATP-binding protein [Bacteroidales bacterium]MCR5714269.1 phosphate ABC transporter ATP-binding protein [Bacteroidales bacterium]
MAIEIRDLNVHIKDAHILKHVNLTIPEKQITCIIGPSGCGKSTLLRTMNRLIDSTEGVRLEGKVLVDGADIIGSGAGITELRRRIGLVSQRPCPLPMSIFDNVAYGCRINKMYKRRKGLIYAVQKNLKAVGLWDEVRGRVRTPASRLSIGQQQRLCLARSLAVEPQYILADEATSALDPVSSKTVEDLFVALKRDYTIVMVTHTLHQALRIADNVVFMYLGEIVEAGPAAQVFHNPQQELTRNYLSGVFS